MKQFVYVIKDPIGLHARPAGLLVKEARTYKSRITVSTSEKSAEATKLMALMAMCVKNGMTITVSAEGEDENECIAGLKKFFEENL